MANLSGKYAIVGIGQTKKLGKVPEMSTMALHLECMKYALDDAGLKKEQIDGFVSNQPLSDPAHVYATQVAHYFGIHPRYCTDLAFGGATPILMVEHACMAIEAGLADYVMCVHARSQRTSAQFPKHGKLGGTEVDWTAPFGLVGAPAMHAFAARRHMHEFGTTSAQLAEVAVSTRYHASLNPTAEMRTPITVEDVLNSRWITEPLHLLDCCLNSDGGGAVIVTTAERAQSLPAQPIYILGFGSNTPHADFLEAPSHTTLGGAVSSKMAYQMAGLGPKDMQFAEIYDCFTITTMITLEDYGFCQKGEGGSFVQGGRIRLGGELPVNTHGGLLSQAHIEGELHILEAVQQLRHDITPAERQVPNATVGIVSGHGGNLHCHTSLILSNQRPS